MSGEKKDRGGVVGNRGDAARMLTGIKMRCPGKDRGALLKLRDKEGGATSGASVRSKIRMGGKMGCNTTTLTLTLTIKEKGTISYLALS